MRRLRFRIGTLLLLVIIAALATALWVQHERAARREAELQARLAESWPLLVEKRQMEALVKALEEQIAGLNAVAEAASLRSGQGRDGQPESATARP